ncbi:D-alanyl-lipoteichoic acid biosynthesis protein DltD [Algibacter sp. 2305UL17-15]|uniref:D-alanyl-lipoteichoic acid biosynthesis protein DltD n=1 Tax=Algibacter sp. 2305UL17-15 TaxID=3231268 RepID=UPI0034588F74
MRNFVSNCFKYLGLFLLICLGSLLFNSLLLNNYGYKVEKDQNVLILGDSHTEYALDDTVFKNSVNLSHSADSYFYSYLKIRKMKKENPQIDTLLLALSNHNLLLEYEERWIFNTAHIKSKFRIYTDLMDLSDFMFLFKSNPSAVIQGIIESPKYSIKLLFNGELIERDLGKFHPSQRNSLLKDIEHFKNNKYHRSLEYSNVEMKYLFNIVNFCKENDIELIFISTPVHPEYNKFREKEFETLKKFYNSELSDFKYLDFSEFDMPDKGFQDMDHLNAEGAELFTRHVIKEMKFK